VTIKKHNLVEKEKSILDFSGTDFNRDQDCDQNFFMLCRNHSESFDALGGFAPATGASPNYDNDVLPVT
jgi:hypothetical protein